MPALLQQSLAWGLCAPARSEFCTRHSCPQAHQYRPSRRLHTRLVPQAALHGDFADITSRLVHTASANLPALLDHVQQRAAADMLLLGQADPAGAAAAVQEVAKDTASGNKSGFFNFFANIFEVVLKVLDSQLSGLHVPYSYGFSIILLTVIVKLGTFPLTSKQVESTTKMQALQPRVKALQESYKGKPQDEMQMKVAQLYKDAEVNPLAGCLPTLVTLPVWIGLYRALSNVADEGLLTEGFFWIPSLAGPTSLAAQKTGGGFSWLFAFQNGQPPLGWPDTIAYLVLPVALVASQFVTQRIMQPPSQDPQQQQTAGFLKFLPLLIGWFSLNVPSGLTLYWFTNNLLSTGQQLYLKQKAAPLPDSLASSSSGSSNRVRAEDLEPPKQVLSKKAANTSSTDSGRGARFRQMKAEQAAKKVANTAGQITSQALGSDPATGGKGAEQAVDKASNVVTGDRNSKDKDNGKH